MNISQVLGRFIRGIRMLAIPRIEDLPYATSPPIQFTYESTATLNLGIYNWNDAPSALTPDRPISHNSLYYFRHVSLSADTEELDFTTNITTTPEFFMFLKSGANVPHFREPIRMLKFFEDWDYRLAWWTPQAESNLTDGDVRTSDRLRAAFRGTLVQGAGLIGKNDITLKAVIAAQEIVDSNFINSFKKAYPESMHQSTIDRAGA